MLQSPFFIIGCGRSGNTLLREMLNQHPIIAIPLESLFILDYLHARPKIPFETLKRLFIREYEIKEWQLSLTLEDFHGCQTALDLINRAHELYLKKHQKTVWGQKTPRFIRYAEELKQVYPHAKFIHIIRDPRAVVNSLITSNAHRSNTYYGSLRWVHDVRYGLEFRNKYPDAVLEIRYEHLIKHTRDILQEICAFLGIAFHEALLHYHEKTHDEFSNKYFHDMVKNVKFSPDISRLDGWKKELSPRKIQLIEAICATLMTQLGYEFENQNPTINLFYLTFNKLQRLVGVTQQLWHYATTRPGYLLCNLRRKLILGLLFQDISMIRG